MKFKIAVAAMALCFAALIHAQTSPAAKPVMTVYKDPSCGCCSKWIEHMQQNGFEVKALDVADIDVVKKGNGVPPALSSCHTAVVGGYVVEGHVPASAVKRMLAEKPAIAGIAVPGMPAGSPGMELPGRHDSFSVVSFDKAGKQSLYEKH